MKDSGHSHDKTKTQIKDSGHSHDEQMKTQSVARSPKNSVGRELAVTLNLSEHEDLKLKKKCEKTLEAAWNTSAVPAKNWKSQEKT